MHVLAEADRPAGHVERARAYLTELDAVSLLRLYDAATEA
jgi:hypothetical protein